jgi:hypothetical protein
MMVISSIRIIRVGGWLDVVEVKGFGGENGGWRRQEQKRIPAG